MTSPRRPRRLDWRRAGNGATDSPTSAWGARRRGARPFAGGAHSARLPCSATSATPRPLASSQGPRSDKRGSLRHGDTCQTKKAMSRTLRTMAGTVAAAGFAGVEGEETGLPGNEGGRLIERTCALAHTGNVLKGATRATPTLEPRSGARFVRCSKCMNLCQYQNEEIKPKRA